MELYWIAFGINLLNECAHLVQAHDCSSSESVSCRDELDNLSSQGMKHNFLDNEEHLDKMCRTQHQAVQCVRTYAESCLPLKEQEFFKLLTQGSDQFFYDFCSDGSEMRKDYLEQAKCIKSISSKLDECTEEYEISQKILNEQETETRQLRKKTCCIYFDNIQCSSNVTAEACGKKAAEVVKQLWTLLGGTYLNEICQPYEEDYFEHCSPASTGSKLTNQNNILITNFLSLIAYGASSYYTGRL